MAARRNGGLGVDTFTWESPAWVQHMQSFHTGRSTIFQERPLPRLKAEGTLCRKEPCGSSAPR